MSTPHRSGLPQWLVERLEEAKKNPRISSSAVDKILEPTWNKDEGLPPRSERVHARANSSTTQEIRQKKTKVRAEKDTEIDEAVRVERRPNIPNESLSRSTESAATLAVNKHLPKRAPGKVRQEKSSVFGLPSPAKSPEAGPILFDPEKPTMSTIPATLTTPVASRTYPAPNWYTKIDTQGRNFKNWTKHKMNTQANQSLQTMKDCIHRCEKETSTKHLPEIFTDLWREIYKAEVTLNGLDGNLLRKCLMFHRGDQSLVTILTSAKVEYPSDLRADALQLYTRWYNEDFKIDLLRGIITKTGARNTDSLDPDWPHRRSADYYGQGHLVLGQWWPTQLCLVRDGAHGMAQGGIYGKAGRGAYSIVLSSGGYRDEDTGDTIWYSGTESKDLAKTKAKNATKNNQTENDLATENTQRLMESCDVIKQPVRVFRSHNQLKSSPHRPEKGFRYDGLYDVVEYQQADEEKGTFRFFLTRQPGQNPIRSQPGSNSQRPTKYEIAEYTKLKL